MNDLAVRDGVALLWRDGCHVFPFGADWPLIKPTTNNPKKEKQQ